MSKLLKLKQWLTVPDAAKYLTDACEEDVSEADVLRFALDGQLTLSVFFANKNPQAKQAWFVPFENSSLCGGAACLDGNPLPSYDGEEVLETDDEQVALSGVWDLPMIGGDKLDIEHRYQLQSGGKAIAMRDPNGVFVVAANNLRLFQLQDFFNDGDNNYSYYPALCLPGDSILLTRHDED